MRDSAGAIGAVEGATAPEPLMLWHPLQRTHAERLGIRLVRSGVLESAETFGRIRDEAARILAQCLPPEAPCGRRTGVLIGYAPSSETLSMTAVATLARDNGFRLVIAIAGKTEEQFRATRDRFERDLDAAASAPAGWTAWSNPTLHRDQGKLDELVQRWTDPRLAADEQPALFVSVIRHPVHLDQLAKLLEQHDLDGVSALVLDEEHESSGSSARRVLAADPGAIHACVARVRDALRKHTLLEYTAAAQAPFVIGLLDLLSPDFVDVLESGDGFCGGRAFFLENAALVDAIAEDERPEAVTGAEDPPQSLLRALRLFALGVAAGMRRRVGEHHSMLVHPPQRADFHRAYRGWIESTLRRWGDVLARAPGNRERQAIAADFETSHRELAARVGTLPPLEELLISIAMEMPRVLVTEVESTTGIEVKWSDAFTHVIVGGQKLEGSHVLKGLTVTYMPKGRGTSPLDTIEQRARFFGYRRQQVGFCRVFLQDDLAQLYRERATQEERVREHVIAHRARATRDLRRSLILDERCQPTRKSIAAQPFFRTQTRGWFKQKLPHFGSALDGNTRRVESFLAGRRFARHARWPHQVATCKLVEVIELLGKYAFGPEELLEAQIFIEQLMKLRGASADAMVALYLMQPDPRPRTTRSESDATIELHEPRAADADGYPGDAAMRDLARVTLQIHWLRVARPRDGREVLAAARIPALAIHIPQGL